VTVKEALDSIGYRGATAVGTQKFSSFVELHIEQGPILEAENKTIGGVDSGQGVLWYDGKITGFESHAGSTPMPLRRDALATLSEIVLAMERVAKEHGPKAVGTIGEAVIAPPRATSFRRDRLQRRLPQRRRIMERSTGFSRSRTEISARARSTSSST
jgi:N-carbamoyl-L-amino-acid hydrolase